MDNKNIMCTIAEGSDIVHISSFAIRQLCRENKIKYIQSGRKIYIALPSLLEYCGLSTQEPEV